jgi:shikimate dehydrogenase
MTRRFAVIGDPVSQSLSPTIHASWYKKYNIDAVYDVVQVPDGQLPGGIARLIAHGYDGWNVTIPHKVTMMDLCDVLDASARSVGAVNTVYVREGQRVGANTDAGGAMAHLDQSCPGWDRKVKSPLILGAGGAARAIAYGLRQRGFGKYKLVSRSEPNKESFPGAAWIPWTERHSALLSADLVIQTTPLGMAGQVPLEISLAGMSPGAIIYDIVYKPLETPLILDARMRGHDAVTGLGMLVHQARMAFELWFGFAPEIDGGLMREIGY